MSIAAASDRIVDSSALPFDSERSRELLDAAFEACREAAAIERRAFRSAELVVESKEDGSPVTAVDRAAEEAIRSVLRRATPEYGILGEELGEERGEQPGRGDGRRIRWIVDPLDGTKNFVAGLPYFAVLLALEVEGEIVLGVVHAPAIGAGAVTAGSARAAGGIVGETWWAVRGGGAWACLGTEDREASARRLRVSTVSRAVDAFVAHGGLGSFQAQSLWTGFSAMVSEVYRTRGFGDWWGHVLVAEGLCDAMVEARVAYHDVAPIKLLVEEAGGRFVTRDRTPLDAEFSTGVLSTNGALSDELRGLLGF